MNEFNEHAIARGLKPWHNVWKDNTTELIYFPLYSGTKLVGLQKYNWKATTKEINRRYCNYINKSYKECTAYGWDNCYGHGPLFIVEGVWDSLIINNCWYDCIAVLCNDAHKQLRSWLKTFIHRPIITICDKDENNAGNKLSKLGDYSFTCPNNKKDVGELSHDEANEFLLTIMNKINL